MRTFRFPSWLGGAAIFVGCLGGLTPALAQDQIVEKIPLQYVDARYVALTIGGRVLPTEADLWMGRYLAPGAGAVGGGVGAGSGILADPSTNSILALPGSQFGGVPSGSSLLGDPRSNSLLIGPRGGNPAQRAPVQGRLYGMPGNNSLLYRYR